MELSFTNELARGYSYRFKVMAIISRIEIWILLRFHAVMKYSHHSVSCVRALCWVGF
jgi:hypothetical protein